MAAELHESQTYLPEHQEQLATIASFLDAHHSKHGERPERYYYLTGADEHDRVEVPKALHRVLVQAVAALTAGKAVTISPTSQKLTTQQAADLLGVSRPTVVRLIEAGELPAERIGNRRKVSLGDLLTYRDARRRRQYAALVETADGLSEEEDPRAVQERLERIRRRRGERRRTPQDGKSPDDF